jgi:hypothetical protein
MKQLRCLIIAALTMTVLHGICRADDKREEKPRFKGVELYSWKDREGDWMFVLLDGTNRVKTEQEVKGAKKQIKGAEDLKKALARLAVGEQVSWTHRIKGFEFPPKATREGIQRAAQQAKIDLQTLAQKDVRGVARERTTPKRLEFEKRILDGSKIGVLFPTFADFDGDGTIDLLVGVNGDKKQTLMRESWIQGHLLVYLNRGTNAAPVYAKPYRFDDVVPSGRIPGG